MPKRYSSILYTHKHLFIFTNNFTSKIKKYYNIQKVGVVIKMLEFRERSYDDPEYDVCGSTCIAVIDLSNMKIPLCRECIGDLFNGIEKFKNTVFCEKCEHFIMSESGWKYGGSCQLRAKEHGKIVTSLNAGYDFCVGCLDTCKNARLKK